MMRRALLLLALAGCATPPPATAPAGPVIAPPLPPASLGRELARSELVTGDYGERSYRMRVELEVTAERLVVVGLSLAGVPLFTLEQTAAGLAVDSRVGDRLPFDPAYMLSDLQLVHWPADVLARALTERGLQLELPAGQRRVIDRDGRPLIEIAYGDVTTLRHLDRHYRLRIETIAR
jgi:hypothetical protein